MSAGPSSDPFAGKSLREMVLDHDDDIESLMLTRSEQRGALALLKFTLGTSLVSSALAIITIIAFLTGAR